MLALVHLRQTAAIAVTCGHSAATLPFVKIFRGMPLVLLLVLVSGCSAPLPVPTAAACTPSSAKISWDLKSPADDVSIGTFVTTVKGALSVTKSLSSAAEVTYSDGTLNELTHLDPATTKQWQRALLAAVRTTGQVSTGFGAGLPLPETSSIQPVTPVDGTYVTDVALNQFRVPFSIVCSHETAVTGWIVGSENGGTASTLIQCGVDPQHPTAATARAESHCP